jgi:hypothetical protein
MEEKKYITADELEAARLDVLKFGGAHKKSASRYSTISIVAFILLFVVGIIFVFMRDNGADIVVPAMIVCGGLFVFCAVMMGLYSKHHNAYMKFLNPYNTMYKTQFLPGILSESFDKVYAFEPQNGLSKEIVKECGLFPHFDYITTNDYFRAKCGDMKFEYCDIELQERQEERDADGDTRTKIVTVFLGIFIISEFDHFVDTPLYITAGGGHGNVTTESENFNRQFSVKCDNDVDALRILTPAMMDHIIKIKEFLKRDINLAFFDDKIFFNSSIGGDRFEIAGSIEQPISESRKKIDGDIKFVKELLELLNMRNLKSRSSQRVTTDEDFAGHSVYQNERK